MAPTLPTSSPKRIHEQTPPFFLIPAPHRQLSPSPNLNNSLQLMRIPERVLNDAPADLLLLGGRVAALGGLGRVGEVDVAVADGPAALAGKVDDGALRVEEEEGLCGGDGEGGVGLFGGGGDLGADLGGEDLGCLVSGAARMGIGGGWWTEGRAVPRRRRCTPRRVSRPSAWRPRRGRSSPPSATSPA